MAIRKSILAWKLGKIAIAISLVSSCAYVSLKHRVEEELGEGSWEHWIRATPEVEDYTPDPKDELRPRNLKARFWTGVPRTLDESTIRIDRSGYSLGLSRQTGKTLWLASYIPGGNVPAQSPPSIRKWEIEEHLPSSYRERTSPGKGRNWVHYVPPTLMKDYYSHDRDTWMTGNRFGAPKGDGLKAWSKGIRILDKYARLYSGVVVFIIPIYDQDTSNPREIGLVLIRPSETGPTVMCLVASFPDPPSLASWRMMNLSDLEKKTGVFLFADLPSEWRNFLIHPSQNREWVMVE
jgi:hypothetical protein